MANCSNRTSMKVTSRHYFPKDETLLQKCFWFVRIHRKDVVPVKKSALDSAHFDDICFPIVGIPVYDDSRKLVESPKRRWWVEIKVQSLSTDSEVEL